MKTKIEAEPEPSNRAVTLQRDGQLPLCFSGEKIGSASRSYWFPDEHDDIYRCEVKGRLFRTIGGRYVVGIEKYNRDRKDYEKQAVYHDDCLEGLVETLRAASIKDDLIAELFCHTEIADQLV